MKPLTLAVVGLRHLHPRSYMPLFAMMPQVRVIAVVEADAGLRETFAREFGLGSHSDVSSLLRHTRPDIAAIFLPHAECAAAAIDCARAGVHVMVEKPVSSSAAGAASIVAAANASGVKFTTGYCWRFHPVAHEIKRLVAQGVIGRVIGGEGRCAAGRLTRYVEGNSAWMLHRRESGGGPLFNLGVHWIDLFRWILGDEVEEVSGRNVKVNESYDIEDNSCAHLQFTKGALVSLNISYTVPNSFPHGRDLYISIRGTEGVLSWAPAYEGQKDVLELCSDHVALAGAPLRRFEFELERVPGYSGYMGREYVREFIDAIQANREPVVTGSDAVAALRVVEAFYRAAEAREWRPVRPSGYSG